ncbi:3-hydroxyacyl-CoA dehydrogenase NAD-binding domain-containing protein [Streptomyces sp. TRM76323]|uniref:3-hydroxyacyl-CoA dehydrogenase NAD-binding domain-containing protein n=1 Tax=Streptomyces tamarix TaxID=3078565 RepID=A0ABU3QD35_9ACTN|nr:3-hydroxyacyl-CoA dehydrogenase NAD-binding domain-containing protein [Streptomyces tamarix]MDT9680682.1 3-hydroxyacyl-CoA dehydrogenase NAD-binding domain-containing protein [Streptomyces tamarix]
MSETTAGTAAAAGGAGPARTAAVIGTGTIGLGWIALFAAAGMAVRVNSRRPDAERHVRAALGRYAATLPGGPRDPEELAERLRFEPDVARVVEGADIVQENAPEDLALKRDLFARAGAAAGPRTLLLSSTSTLLPDDLGSAMDDPSRLLVAHPFNPPHIVPLVEVVAGERTDPAAVDDAVAFYRGLGKTPTVLRRPVPGFVANRLQSALLRESIHLVREGVVSVAELDEIVTASIGPRWAAVGPFRAFHLGGGPGGLRHWFQHLGVGLERSWAGLGEPPVDEATVGTVIAQADEAFGAHSYERLAADRDTVQNAVIAAVARARATGPGAAGPDTAGPDAIGPGAAGPGATED